MVLSLVCQPVSKYTYVAHNTYYYTCLITVDLIYADKLKAEGIASDADIKGWEKEYMDALNTHFELAKKITKLSIREWIDTPWTGFFEAVDPNKVCTLVQYFCFNISSCCL